MSLESRRIVRGIKSAIGELELAAMELREEEGFEPDFSSAVVDLENASSIIVQVIDLCNEQ